MDEYIHSQELGIIWCKGLRVDAVGARAVKRRLILIWQRSSSLTVLGRLVEKSKDKRKNDEKNARRLHCFYRNGRDRKVIELIEERVRQGSSS